MNVTEAEAKLKWCPQSRVAFPGGHVGNRPSSALIRFAQDEAARTGASQDSRELQYLLEQRADTHCIGSRCMWWRFTGYREVPGGNDEAHGTCGAAVDIPEPLRQSTGPK